MHRTILSFLLLLFLLPLTGAERWIKTYDPFDIGYNKGYASEDMTICADGGYAMNGTYTSDMEEGFFGSAYLMKTDAEGNLQWARLAQDDTSLPYYSDAMCFTQTPDGGFLEIVAATFSSQCQMIKRDTDGNLQWVRPTGNGTIDSIVRLSDDSYILAGYYNLPDWGLYLLKLSPDFEQVWERHYLINGHWGHIFSLCVSNNPEPESGFIGIGEIYASNSGRNWTVLAKFNAEGDSLWSQMYGEDLGFNHGYGVVEGQNGDIYTSDVYEPDTGYYTSITRRNEMGDSLEAYIYPHNMFFSRCNIAFGHSESQLLTVSPTRNHDLVFGCVSNVSTLDWARNYTGYSFPMGDRFICCTDDGGYVFISGYDSGSDIAGVVLFKTDENGMVDAEDEVVPRPDQTLAAYPNPFNPSTTVEYSLTQPGVVEITLYNIKGQKVTTLFQGRQDTGTHTVPWNGTDSSGSRCPSGMYLCQMRVGGEIQHTAKLLLMK
jgi:hypothetical protein